MAKFSIEFDSVEKTMSITQDGQAVPDVTEIIFYRRWDEKGFTLSVYKTREDKENDMVVRETVYASDRDVISTQLARDGEEFLTQFLR